MRLFAAAFFRLRASATSSPRIFAYSHCSGDICDIRVVRTDRFQRSGVHSIQCRFARAFTYAMYWYVCVCMLLRVYVSETAAARRGWRHRRLPPLPSPHSRFFTPTLLSLLVSVRPSSGVRHPRHDSFDFVLEQKHASFSHHFEFSRTI